MAFEKRARSSEPYQDLLKHNRPLGQGQAKIVKARIHFMLAFTRQFYRQASASYLEAICKRKTLPTFIHYVNISGAISTY